METRNFDSGYYIERKDAEKKVIVHFDGFTKPEMIGAFLKDYEVLKKSVDVKNIELYLNGKTLKAFPRELENNLKDLYTDYTSFKKIYIVKPDQIVTQMQIQRVLKSANIENHFEFIDSINDVK